ncbi:helicase-associated domain-containing protein [bacterium]|nr:helicase-associated domain-containing protein [candidate division CSSED10-310 bacterium]
MNLVSCLAGTPVKDLRAIAAFNGIEIPAGTSRNGLHSILIGRLSDRDWIALQIDKLDFTEREILYQLFIENGDIPGERLANIWGGDDSEASSRWFWGQDISPGLPTLRMKGLVFLLQDMSDGQDHYVLPDPVLENMPGESPPESVYRGSAAPYNCLTWSTSILSDIFILIRYLEEYKVRPLKDGGLSKRDLRILVDRISRYDGCVNHDWYAYLRFIYRFCRKSMLLKVRHNRLQVETRFAQWVKKGSIEQLMDLYHSWLEDDGYDEFRNISDFRILSAGLRNPARTARKTAMRIIGSFQPGRWIPLNGLLEYFRQTHPRFLRPMPDDRHWRVQMVSGMADRENVTGWDLPETHMILFYISGPLLWLGAITLGMDQSDNPDSILINPLGEYIFGKRSPDTELPETVAANTIIIQPDHEILVPENAVLSIRYMVETFTELVLSGPISRYRISRNSIAGGLLRGLTVPRILDFLQSVSISPVPQNVQASIEFWGEQHGRVMLKHAILLETQDAYLMKELLMRPAIRRKLQDQIGATHATVHAGNLNALLKEIKKAGYMPRISTELMLQWEPAPISLQLTRETAESLLRNLETMKSNDSTGPAADNISELETIAGQLRKILETLE